MRKSRVFALGVVVVVALRLLSEVPAQLRAQHEARRSGGGSEEASSLLMYDGVCNLCNGEWVVLYLFPPRLSPFCYVSFCCCCSSTSESTSALLPLFSLRRRLIYLFSMRIS